MYMKYWIYGAAACLIGLSLVTPSILSEPSWTQIDNVPVKYHIRLENVGGTYRTPKLHPPAGANVIAQVVGGGLAGDRVSWSVTQASWQPSPNDEISATCFVVARLVTPSGYVPSSASGVFHGTSKYFDISTSYVAGEGGTEAVSVSTVGLGPAVLWTATGEPVSVEVSPAWNLNTPGQAVTLDHSETYTVDILFTW